MNRILATVEGDTIFISDAKPPIIFWVSKAAIDGDGSGPSHSDPDFQSDTSLHFNGSPLDSDQVRYIVVPPAILEGVPEIVLGCQAFATYGDRCFSAVVGDIGPRKKLGEISIALARALGIPCSPTTGGVPSGVAFQVRPGVPADVDGVIFNLQPS